MHADWYTAKPSTTSQRYDHKFLDETIIPVPFAKDLGMTLDSYLTYDQNITNLVSSCMNSLCQIK
jgi:hypothetical protein